MQRPFLPLILIFLAGIVIAGSGLIPLDVPILIIVLSILTLTMSFLLKTRKAFYVILCIFFFSLGALRYTSHTTLSHDNIAQFLTRTPKDILIYGDVVSIPERRGRYFNEHDIFNLKVSRMLLEEEEYSVSGLVRVKVFKEGTLPKIGDAIAVEGAAYLPKGKTNPAGFDYKRYLNTKGISALITSSGIDICAVVPAKASIKQKVLGKIGKFRGKAQGIIARNLPREASGMVETSLLGTRGSLSTNFKDIFTKTGTMHILAVSGLHVGIIAITVVFLLKLLRVPSKIIYLVAILSIAVFAFLTGGRPSTVRAAVMGSFVLLGLMGGRKTDIVSALFLSAFLICFIKPSQIFDAGFILSYSAVLSIIYLSGVVDVCLKVPAYKHTNSFIIRSKITLLKSLSVSIAICVGMMPIVAYYFKIITPSAVIANLVAVPFLFLMIVLGAVVVFTGSISFLIPVAATLGSVLGLLITLFAKVMDILGALPLSHFRVPAPGALLFILYYSGVGALIYTFRKEKGSFRTLLVFILFSANLFIWPMAMNKTSGTRVVFFDTGRADAALIETPMSITLIDTGLGDKFTAASSGSSIIAPYLWQRGHAKIDNMLITHFHDDHVGGSAYLIDNFKIENAIIGKGTKLYKGEELNNYTKFMDAVRSSEVHMVKAGDSFEAGGVNYIVMNPPKSRFNDQNADSVAVKANIDKGPSILFCADVTSGSMKEMMRYGTLLASDIIKIPHHGQGMGEEVIVTEFIKMVSPQYAIIPNNSEHDLNRYILKVLEEIGAKVFITGEDGAVVVESEGGSWSVRAYNEQDASCVSK